MADAGPQLSKAAKRRAREAKRVTSTEKAKTDEVSNAVAEKEDKKSDSGWAASHSYGREQCAKWAHATLSILEAGWYRSPLGQRVELLGALDNAVNGTHIHLPKPQLPLHTSSATVAAAVAAAVAASAAAARAIVTTVVEITQESTLEAAFRLCVTEAKAGRRVALLNFASAKNPGGGFLNGRTRKRRNLPCRAASIGASLGQRREPFTKHTAAPRLSCWADLKPR